MAASVVVSVAWSEEKALRRAGRNSRATSNTNLLQVWHDAVVHDFLVHDFMPDFMLDMDRECSPSRSISRQTFDIRPMQFRGG